MRYFQIEQIYVLNSERLFSDPINTLRDIAKFLEINTNITLNDVTPKNVGSNKAKVPADVHQYLNDFFSPYNAKLYNLIGQKFCW